MSARLEERLRAITEEARLAGYAITWWSPDELGDTDVDQLIDVVVERGNIFIGDLEVIHIPSYTTTKVE